MQPWFATKIKPSKSKHWLKPLVNKILLSLEDRIRSMPNYLGIDYGTKRIGLAWADELGIALPIGAISGVDSDRCFPELREEVKKGRLMNS